MKYFLFASFPSSERISSAHAIITCSSQLTVLPAVKTGSSRIQKRIRYTVGLAVPIFPAVTRTFTKDTELSEHGRGTARHGMVYVN